MQGVQLQGQLQHPPEVHPECAVQRRIEVGEQEAEKADGEHRQEAQGQLQVERFRVNEEDPKERYVAVQFQKYPSENEDKFTGMLGSIVSRFASTTAH